MSGCGILLSIALFLMVRGWEKRELTLRATEFTRGQVEQLQVSLLRSIEVLHSIAALHAVEGGITRAQFHAFVGPALARQPELQALSWNPEVSAADRVQVERAAELAGLGGFRFREHDAAGELIPEPARTHYVPVLWIEPPERNALALGFDLESDPLRRGSLDRARATGQPAATAPVRLAQGPTNQAGVLVVRPVYSPPSPTGVRVGFAVAVFRVADLVGETFRNLANGGIDAALFDESPNAERLHGNPRLELSDLASLRTTLEFAGRTWSLVFQPGPQFVATQSRARSNWVLIGGLVGTVILSCSLVGSWRRAEQVDSANRALQAEVRERQQAEASAAAANQAKSDFLANMSHEMRTPLNAILGYAQLMRRDRSLSPEQQDSVAGISTSGGHLLGLINEILDLSKIEAGRMELNPVEFDLARLIRSLTATFRPLCAEKHLQFRLEPLPPGLGPVHGDEGKLRQVLINLLGNAVKFTRRGEVALRCVPQDSKQWLFEVIDTGLGIPEAEQGHIFEPFHQGRGAAHHGGTGLGLAIARRQVELLGGTLELQSTAGIGSRFYFSIALPASVQRAHPIEPEVRRLLPGCRVRALVVDDRRENREVLAGLLRSVGCEVRVAVDGAEALAAAADNWPDIVFLDLLLPGMSGLETAQRLRHERAGLRIVAHTASGRANQEPEARAAGCCDFLTKPVPESRLFECLERYANAKFERTSVSEDPEPLLEPTLQMVTLPEDLLGRLTVAAELHSATALKAALQELRGAGPEARMLAETLRHRLRSYDMDGILRILNDTTRPNPLAAMQPPNPP